MILNVAALVFHQVLYVSLITHKAPAEAFGSVKHSSILPFSRQSGHKTVEIVLKCGAQQTAVY